MSLRLFKKKAGKLEPTYYMRRKKQIARAKTKAKYINMVIFLLIIPAIVILYHVDSLRTAQNELIDSLSDNSTIQVLRNRSEALRAKNETLSTYDETLAKLGTMGQAIKRAGIEFGDNEEESARLIGLMIGIANAESGFGKNFVIAYDKNCFNHWGIKGGNTIRREDGSYLRCFINEDAGARTVAKALKLYYLNEGRDTPEKICQKWIGANFANVKKASGRTHCEDWVNNVNKYFAK